MEASPILETRDLKKYYPVTKGIIPRPVDWVRAVDGVSFKIMPATTLGLVGESGCGKTTLGRLILRLINPDSGNILFDGKDISSLKKGKMRSFRKDMQIIFQDPFGSLNPRFTVHDIVGEGLKVFNLCESKKVLQQKVVELLDMVGLPGNILNRYPHEFSGGQRQRLGIARALALNPRFIVCDEPVSSLDVSIQAQVINLLQSIKEKLKLSYLFISHDLSVVYHVSDYVAVMYRGQIMEYARGEDVYTKALHPYTKALLSAIPAIGKNDADNNVILEDEGSKPSDNYSQGCVFCDRCPYIKDECKENAPHYNEKMPGHFVRCHFA
ncbi:MAG: ABC transporter ATP-binding protein [Candidatus Ancaeobacter aquaticus]|nr:ABC transporter ATP-binding protein [Candidatus Ancaeobacter aquaticus]